MNEAFHQQMSREQIWKSQGRYEAAHLHFLLSDHTCLVSDCIVEYTSNREDKRFTVNDIWYSDYTVENVQQIFSKPNPTQKASNEYDKYFGQPIKLLDAAGVIHGEKSGRGYTYSIVNQELLEYISFRERNSFNFQSVVSGETTPTQLRKNLGMTHSTFYRYRKTFYEKYPELSNSAN